MRKDRGVTQQICKLQGYWPARECRGAHFALSPIYTHLKPHCLDRKWLKGPESDALRNSIMENSIPLGIASRTHSPSLWSWCILCLPNGKPNGKCPRTHGKPNAFFSQSCICGIMPSSHRHPNAHRIIARADTAS